MAPIVIPTRLGWWISLEVWVLTTVEIVGFDDGGSVGVGVNGFFFFFCGFAGICDRRCGGCGMTKIGGWQDWWSRGGYGIVVVVAL